MRIFVASWFFPPNTSAEGIVTFKLLKYSAHQYDVCCSKSRNWSYEQNSNLVSDNINTIAIDTDDIMVWVKQCIKTFKKYHRKYHYKYFMTRSMPPESILIGEYIKKIDPSIRWIASFGDPIYRNPYEFDVYIYRDILLRKLHIQNLLLAHPKLIPYTLGNLPISKFRLLKKLYFLEKTALQIADKIVVPSQKQLEYLLQFNNYKKYRNKCVVIPHSYDEELYPKKYINNKDKIIITYIGYMDEKRIPEEFFQALVHLKQLRVDKLKNLRIQFVGNISDKVKDMVEGLFLEDICFFKSSVSYQESLRIMKESDYLLHIDANFDFLNTGSIFLASKLIDYIGSQKRILILSDIDSEAATVIGNSQGIILERNNFKQISETIINLLDPIDDLQICDETYSAKNIAREFDQII